MVVLFYGDKCGHCTSYKAPGGNWEKLKNVLQKKGIAVEEVNAWQDRTNPLLAYKSENGVPETAFLNAAQKVIAFNMGNFCTDNLTKSFLDMPEGSVQPRRGSGRRAPKPAPMAPIGYYPTLR